jgi:hypothetical protein
MGGCAVRGKKLCQLSAGQASVERARAGQVERGRPSCSHRTGSGAAARLPDGPGTEVSGSTVRFAQRARHPYRSRTDRQTANGAATPYTHTHTQECARTALIACPHLTARTAVLSVERREQSGVS